MAGYSAKTCIYITPRGDCLVDDQGHLVMDSTVASRATVRLRAHRGKYHRDRNFGSRLHEPKTLEQWKREFLPICQEALKPLIDAGEIKRIEQGSIETDEGPGLFKAELFLYVTEEEVYRIAGLPLATWRY